MSRRFVERKDAKQQGDDWDEVSHDACGGRALGGDQLEVDNQCDTGADHAQDQDRGPCQGRRARDWAAERQGQGEEPGRKHELGRGEGQGWQATIGEIAGLVDVGRSVAGGGTDAREDSAEGAVGYAVPRLEDHHDPDESQGDAGCTPARHAVVAGGGDGEQQGDQFSMLLRDIVARGRAAGVIVVAATQRPSHDIIPVSLRDLFGYRLVFRCTTETSSDIILGHGWHTRGYDASQIDPNDRGVGWLLAEGGIPRRMRCSWLTDAEIIDIATRWAR